jgi:uncharacterized protein YegJ (DUF2314 family)
MREASQQARESFRYFWREMTWEQRRIIPACELAVVKAPFSDPGSQVEHMWISDVEFDGKIVRGTLLSSPNEVSSLREGSAVALSAEQLSDWLYTLEGKAYGAFTVQLIRLGMSASKRAAHDEAWGFDFGPPDQIRLCPFPPDDEHPMSENAASSLKDVIQKSPREWFFEPDKNGLTALHALALGGSEGCVRVLLECGADRSLKTPDGRTALELARAMGWPRVVALLEA